MIEYFNSPVERARQRHSGRVWLITERGWITLSGVFLGLAAVVGGFLAGAGLGYLALVVVLLGLVAASMRTKNVRRARAMVAVNYLDQAVRLNLPIAPMLAAAEVSEHGAMRRRLARLRDEIEAGSDIAAALRRAVPGISPRVAGLISAGERLGRLSQALDRATRSDRAIYSDRRNALQSMMLRWYPMVIAIAIMPIYFLVIRLVVPKYLAILRDFGIPVPAATVRIIAFWQWGQWPMLLAAIVVLLIGCNRSVSDLMPSRRRKFGWLALIDRLAWIVPPWRGLIRSRGLADACYVMADALTAGQPADRALMEASEACPNVVLNDRMIKWSGYVGQGMSLADAGAKAALPSILTGMLRTARDTTGASDVFAFLSRYYDGRHSKAAALLEGAAIPVMVAIMAFFVLNLALGLFMPMIELVNHLPISKGVT